MGKNVVVCYDGTGNRFGSNNTNVVKTFQSILLEDERQTALYDPGVGTFSYFGRTVGRWTGKVLGMAFGYGLQENLEDGYRYLMSRYRPDDRLYLFGFSRGAFQARALAGMLNKCGLLPRSGLNLIPYASEIYLTIGNDRIAADFKATFCRDCKPHFIGVWDTVASLGKLYTRDKRFNDDLNHDVRFGFHALAIDERRKKFPAKLWNEAAKGTDQTIEQVWFTGVHSDVGGWYDEHGLSDIALEWMLTNAERQGLLLKEDWRERAGLAPNHMEAMHDSRTGFWRLWRPVTRPIPAGAKIHDSVRRRMEEDHGYRPVLPPDHRFVD